jgi:hypothetical protein
MKYLEAAGNPGRPNLYAQQAAASPTRTIPPATDSPQSIRL